MVNKTNNLKTAISLLLIVVFYSPNLRAQSAKELFNNYHKWGITGQNNIFSAADVTPTNNSNFNYNILKSKRFAFGFEYNFYQYKNWNFKTGVQLQWFGNAENLFISQKETVLSFDINSWSRITDDLIVYLPVTAEYVFLKKGNVNFSLGAGLALSYYRETIGGSFFNIDNQPIFNADTNNNSKPFYTSGHIEASIYFKRKRFMLQTSIIYNKSYKTYRAGLYEFSNLQVSPNTKGLIIQSGDYIGVSLTIYFKKKNKS
ncbi:MAG: hypothetical protein L3J45_10670 [Flavobacteriaceae bacterium]|nr:hypothetical protein [Flavobacteriaceae bacterium]